MRLTKAQIREAVATIYGALCEGKSEIDLLDDMGISAEDFYALKAEMFNLETDKIKARPTEHVYVEYIIQQTQNLQHLEKVITEATKEGKQLNAIVGAVRARSQILDEIIAKGQEFGLIKKMPDRKEVIAGVVVGELSNEELKGLITKELGYLNKLMKTHGDSDITAIEVGPIHSGPRLPASELESKPQKQTDKYNKANSSKRIGARGARKRKKVTE